MPLHLSPAVAQPPPPLPLPPLLTASGICSSWFSMYTIPTSEYMRSKNSPRFSLAVTKGVLKKDQYQDLAPLLWHSFGIVAVLLQEIVLIYPNLLPPSLTAESSLRVCDTLALLQCVASHPDTRMPLITSHAPLFVYPFLYTENKSNPFNHLRLSSLGVIGALVKAYKTDTEVILFLLRTEITPMLLRSMEMGDELSRKLATFIVQKILLDDTGLEFVCSMPERFIAICEMLSSMVAEQPSLELLKYIIGCYLRLSENARVCDTLKSSLPDMLKDATFFSSLKDNSEMREWLQQLLHNVLGPTFGEKPLFVEPS